MHEAYIERVRVAVAVESANTPKVHPRTTLKQICLKAASQHMDVLHTKMIDLPPSLIKDLLPHLNLIDLDRVHPAMKLKGISTSCVWARILREIYGTSQDSKFSKLATSSIGLQGKITDDEWREITMGALFRLAFFGVRFCGDKCLLDVNFNSLLLVMAKYVQHLSLVSPVFLRSFTTDQRAVLSILERTVRRINVPPGKALLSGDPISDSCNLYVLHRLLDHGTTGEVVLAAPDPNLLTCILHSRRSQSTSQRLAKGTGKRTSCDAETNTGDAADRPAREGGASSEDEEHVTPCKRPRLTSDYPEEKYPEEELMGLHSHCQCMDPEHLCQTFTPSVGNTRQTCPRGQIYSLQIKEFGGDVLPVLLPLLPTWRCLCSLSLSSLRIFEEGDVLRLAESLKQLSETLSSSLTDLSVGSLPHPSHMEVLLNACPNLRSFSMEIHPMAEFHRPYQRQHGLAAGQAGLLLENLSVKLPQVVTSLQSLPLVLKRSPNLTSLHVSGIRISRGCSHNELLNTISESNPCLKKLSMEDMNLADCHSAIFRLLGNCMLEELSLVDCRLLEKCSEKDLFIQQLMDYLKKVATLKALNLSQNRLAKTVPALGELFTGASPSTVKRLDISCNFVLPLELLELANMLESNRPSRHMVLDLRRNPLDRDRVLQDKALHILRPLCHLLTDHWDSRVSFADYISSM